MTLFLVDASHYQDTLPVANLHAQGFSALILKATEGTTYRDASFSSHLADALAVNLPVAAYHFLHSGAASAQATLTASVVPPDVPVWVDVEAGANLADGEAYAASLRTDHRHVAGIYFRSRVPSAYGGWWHADYGSDPVGIAPATYAASGGDNGRGWSSGCDIWQYCEHGRIAGYSGDVDFSAYRGTLTELLSHGWFYQRTIDAITIYKERSDMIVRTPVNGDFLFTALGHAPIAKADADAAEAAGFPTVHTGAGSFTSVSAVNDQIIAAFRSSVTPNITSLAAALAGPLATAVAADLPTSPPGTLTAADVETALRAVLHNA